MKKTVFDYKLDLQDKLVLMDVVIEIYETIEKEKSNKIANNSKENVSSITNTTLFDDTLYLGEREINALNYFGIVIYEFNVIATEHKKLIEVVFKEV